MTDEQKIKNVFDLFNVEVSETYGSFKAAGRRFFPNAEGEIEKITWKTGKKQFTVTEIEVG